MDEENPLSRVGMHRPTLDEIQQKIDFVRHCIRQGTSKGKLKFRFRKKFGPTTKFPNRPIPSARTIEDYISKARDEIAADVAVGKENMRNYIGEFYCGVIEDRKADLKNRIRAAECFCQLHGLNEPSQTKTVVSGPGDGPIPMAVAHIDVSRLTEEEQDAILMANAIIRRSQSAQIGSGDPFGPGQEIPFGFRDHGEPGAIQVPAASPDGEPAADELGTEKD
jgi:hypothetical protein